MSEWKHLYLVDHTQLDTWNSTGLTSTSLEDVCLEDKDNSWSSWTAINSNGTNLSLKDGCYYHFQVKVKNSSGNILHDFGIARMSLYSMGEENSYKIIGFACGTSAGRLTLYKVTSNLYATYMYIQTGSAFTSLVPASGYYVRYRRVNL